MAEWEKGLTKDEWEKIFKKEKAEWQEFFIGEKWDKPFRGQQCLPFPKPKRETNPLFSGALGRYDGVQIYTDGRKDYL